MRRMLKIAVFTGFAALAACGSNNNANNQGTELNAATDVNTAGDMNSAAGMNGTTDLNATGNTDLNAATGTGNNTIGNGY